MSSDIFLGTGISRLDSAFAQQTNSEVKLEILDDKLQPTESVNITAIDKGLLPYYKILAQNKHEHLPPEFQGKNVWYNAGNITSELFQQSALLPSDFTTAKDSKTGIYLEYSFHEMARYNSSNPGKTEITEFTIEYVFRLPQIPGSPAQIKPIKLTEEDIKAGKKQVIVEVNNFDFQKHKPLTINLKVIDNSTMGKGYDFISSVPYNIAPLQNYTVDEKGVLHFPELDLTKATSHFYLQLHSPSSTADTVQVKATSTHPSGSEWNDTSIFILSKVSGSNGLYRSQALNAVSIADINDSLKKNANQSLGSQTILALPGSSLSFNQLPSLTLSSGSRSVSGIPNFTLFQSQTLTTSVPIKGVLPVRFYLYKNKEGKDTADEKWVQKQIAELQQDLAKEGVLVKADILVLDAPSGIDPTKKLTLEKGEFLTQYTAKMDPDFKGLRMIPISNTNIVSTEREVEGLAYYHNNTNATLIATRASKHTITHETMHHLTYDPKTRCFTKNHGEEGHLQKGINPMIANLMEERGMGFLSGFHPLASHLAPLTQEESEAMFQNPIMQPPPPRPNPSVQLRSAITL